jgi:hypothetical protein
VRTSALYLPHLPYGRQETEGDLFLPGGVKQAAMNLR